MVTETLITDDISNQKNAFEKQSRGERRTIKALEVFSFKQIDKITKIKIEKKKQVWIINNPEIFQSQNYGSLLVFGDAKVGDGTGK